MAHQNALHAYAQPRRQGKIRGNSFYVKNKIGKKRKWMQKKLIFSFEHVLSTKGLHECVFHVTKKSTEKKNSKKMKIIHVRTEKQNSIQSNHRSIRVTCST